LKLKVEFSPKEEKEYRSKISISSEEGNFSEHYDLLGYGTIPKISISEINSAVIETCSQPINALISFDTTTPNAPIKKSIKIANRSEIPTKFRWIFYYSIADKLERGSNYSQGDEWAIDTNGLSPFDIIPSEGELHAMQTKEFQLTFNPKIVSKFCVIARLVLSEIPSSIPRLLHRDKMQDSNNSLDLHAIELELEGEAIKCPVEIIPPYIMIGNCMSVGQVFPFLFLFCRIFSPSNTRNMLASSSYPTHARLV
jgi:hypothetical protein